VIDLNAETTFPLGLAARRLPRGRRGRPVHFSTLYRWVTAGVRLPDGSVVRLEAVRLGGKWVTSAEALQRFAERLTPPPSSFTDGSLSSASPPLTPSRRERAAAQTGRELDRLGF
jgi:hypothetical protein